MPLNLHRPQPEQIMLPLRNQTVWQQLPLDTQQDGHDLITQLLIHVIQSPSSEESDHEPQT